MNRQCKKNPNGGFFCRCCEFQFKKRLKKRIRQFWNKFIRREAN